METTTENLIQDLSNRINNQIEFVKTLKSISEEKLNWKAAKSNWSVLECLEHLNLYGDFYIPEISQKLNNNKTNPQIKYVSGWLGNYFVKSVSPETISKTMNTFKDKNPIGSSLNISTLDRFEKQLHQLKNLLEKARKVNLVKTKTSISISKLLKLRLGETFRVVIYHNDRHILQAKNVLQSQK